LKLAEASKIILHSDAPLPLLDRLQNRFPDCVAKTCDTYEEMNDLVPSFEPDIVYSVRFAGTPGFPRDVLLGSSGPEWICVGGSGIDHLGHWDMTKTIVTNSAGVAASMMAEYVMGSLLHFNLDVDGLEKDKQSKTWRARKMMPLKGKTMLIAGLGQTGQAVAKLAKAFGMRVIGTRATPKPTDNVDEVFPSSALMSLYPRADCITICTPLLATTKGLIDHDALRAMKPSTLLVDVSRGGVVDQSALQSALEERQIAGAACDVFESEPLSANSALWDLENLLISPHCSSVYDGWELASFDLFMDNLQNWINSKPLFNIVDPQRGY